MTSWRQDLGQQIKTAREARLWTQEKLAQRIGLSRATLNYYERGTVEKLSFDKILKIARELETSFAISGCVLSGTPSNKFATQPKEQFCLEFDKEQVFSDVTLSIRPTREGDIVISTKIKTA
jgi:transcriptional regulator with XRE-family HTH domain